MLKLVTATKAIGGSKRFGAYMSCVHVCLQSHRTEALAGKLSAVYGVMSTPDIIKQKQSHSGHKSQVWQ